MTTMLSSRASAPMRSVVGPGMGSAHSKYSGFVSTQKYMVLNSSGRQTILAPRAPASRTRRSALATLAARSTWPMNCSPAIRTMVSLLLAALTESGHDLLREVADQTELVVEVNTH